ncbi:MAG TPA: MFS transporter [Candidatus Acidoferrales bacterium]|jgi:MFS family permease|nr:MFS transporter [Candidatus Acidoferrales bacterium]
MTTRRPSIFASRAFRQYYAGQTLSYLGDGLRMISIPLLAYHITHSALSTGGAFICEIAPFSLFSLIGGSFADRLDRKKLMIAADALRFSIMAAFAVTFAFHVLTLPMIYGGLILISSAAAFFMGGQSSSIPFMLGRDRSTEAIAMLIAAENVTSLVMPASGAAIYATMGPEPALILNALTYLGSQISLAMIPTLGPDKSSGLPSMREIGQDIALGFRHLWSDAAMRIQAIAGFCFNFFGFGSYAILIPFLKVGFGASDQVVGIFLGLSALGAVIGAAFAARFSRKWPFGRALTTAYVLDAFLFLPIVLFDNIWLCAAAWMASNTVANFEIAQIIGFRMRVSPPEAVGRVMGVVRLVVLAGMAPGVILLGWVSDHSSPHNAMWIACIGYIVIAIVALCLPTLRNETR